MTLGRISFLVLFFSTFLSFGQKKQVCFSFDDLPIVSYGMTDAVFQQELMAKLVKSLERNKIPAIGFINEKKLYNDKGLDPVQIGLMKTWVNSGLDLGNHTFSHPDYNSVSFKEFSGNILKGEKVTKKLLGERGKSIRYFRHPFLHVGDTKAKADSLSDFLSAKGYRVAPVTVDNEDYLFALAYKRAKEKKDTELMSKIGADYITYMEQKLKYFEIQANRLFGRNIKQILLLHASLLNSDYVDSLAKMVVRNEYDFVSMDGALTDEAYKTDVTVYGKWGISWIDRWALSQGKKGDFFKDEPATPQYITKLAE